MLYCSTGPETGAAETEACQTRAFGSAFLYEVDGKTFLVTARHNFTGRDWETNAYLGNYSVSPTHLRVTFLVKPPDEGWRLSPSDIGPHIAESQIQARIYLIPLIGEDWHPIWMQHPIYGPDMDVAVLAFNLTDDQLLATPWKSPVTDPGEILWPNLAPGQDVFVLGYPNALTTGPMFPLWIRGSIASEPYFGFNMSGKVLPLMLIDARTRKGQSGSAVIRHKPEGMLVQRREDGTHGITTGAHSQVVGVYSGRTSKESDLGFVWRIDEVDRICREGVPGTT